jgi:hypothetical protein
VRRRFVESRGFSADRARLERSGELTLEDIVVLEQDIMANPDTGDLVPGTGGLRKVRLGQRQVRRGKRGGLRVYYLDLAASKVTHLVAIFGKREKSDLSPAERKAVAALVRKLKEET